MTFDTSKIDKIPSGTDLSAAWKTFASAIDDIETNLSDGKSAWAGLSEQLVVSGGMAGIYSAMDEPAKIADDMKTDKDAVGPAVTAFAEELDGLVEGRKSVHAAIADYNEKWPPEREVKTPWDWWDRRTDRNQINADIKKIEDFFEVAEDRLESALSNGRMAAPAAVPLHHPGGGDAWEVVDASGLYNDIMNGRSKDPKVDWAKLREILAEFTPEQWAEFHRQNPTAFMTVPPLEMDPRANREWWGTLTPEQQQALIENMPALVGNTEGLDYTTRSTANVELLNELLDMTPDERAALGITDTQLNSYKQIKESYNSATSTAGEGQIMSFDPIGPSGRPLAAVVLGNLDDATHQSWYIPGMTTNTERMGGMFGDTTNIYNAQRAELSPDEKLAMVAWVGYDAPEMFSATNHDVFKSDMAREGGRRLEYALEGLNAANEYRAEGQKDPYMSVVAHSYGTTTSAFALSNIDFEVDSAVFFGSAGIDPDAAKSAEDLHIKDVPGKSGETALYAGSALGDHPARLAMVGTGLKNDPRISPTSVDFGARNFSVEGTDSLAKTDGHDGQGSGKGSIGRSSEGHGYVDEKTQSLKSIALASTGKAEDGQGDELEVWNQAEVDYKEALQAYGQVAGQSGGYVPEELIPVERTRK